MRVVVLTEQLRRRVPGGIGTYVRGLLAGLAALDAPDVEVSRWSHPLPTPVVTRLWDRGRLGIRAAPDDVVHAPSLAVPRTRGRLSVFVHDLAWREVPEAYPLRGREWHEGALARALASAAVLLVPSERTAEALAAEAGSTRVHVVGEGCDHLPPPDHEGAAELLTRLGVDGPFLLTVGTIQPRKNLARLVESYARVRDRLPERWPLVVVGAHGWVETLPVTEGVLLAGSPDDGVLAGLYARARCLAYVPLAEGFGLPPVEAMHAGLPVLASPLPSTGGAALEVDPLDVDAIGAGLLAVAADDAARGELVERGRRHAATMTWAETARAHVQVWQEGAHR